MRVVNPAVQSLAVPTASILGLPVPRQGLPHGSNYLVEAVGFAQHDLHN